MPTAFLTYADDRKNLGNLIHEQKAVRAIFEQLKGQGYLDWCERYNLEVEEVYTVFEEATPEKPITIWHYAGHADDYEMLLMNGRVNASGINQFIADQAGLHLVFLNACVTQLQAQDLVDRGVPVVIATTEPVNDEAACLFAQRFYASLAANKTIREAFETAKTAIKAAYGDVENHRESQEKLLRGSKKLFPKNDQPLTRFEPWVLFSAHKKAEAWTLKTAINDPYVGLPTPVIPTQDLPPDPYRSLRPYTANEAELFFGRGWEIRALYQQVMDDHLPKIWWLYGQSGVGKSSLLQAGLMSRLRQHQEVKYYRRDAKNGVLATFESIFGRLKAVNGTEILIAWKATERKYRRPLTIILDQIEEIFTQPIYSEELPRLLEVLYTVFRDKENRPAGKVILGFRKDFLSDMQIAFAKRPEISYGDYALEPFEEANIVEAITGVACSAKIHRQYRLDFEPHLPEKIAHDLAKDRTSAIGPTLQILLDKMWQQVKVNPQREFTEKLYLQILGDGKVLEQFLKNQLDAMAQEAAYAKYMEAGLALDILYHHVTDLGTSDTHTRTALKEHYQHLQKALDFDAFIEGLTSHYLLTQDKDKKTTLMHDTLGPLVQKAFRKSEKMGQRATQVVENKLQNKVATLYARSPHFIRKTLDVMAYILKDKISETIPAYLSNLELIIVKKGVNGMRKLKPAEVDLVKRSKKLRNATRRSYILIILSVLLVVAIINDRQQIIKNQKTDITQKADSLLSQRKLLTLKSERLSQKQREINRKNNLLTQREIDIQVAEKRLTAMGASFEANRIYLDNPNRSIRLAYEGYQQSEPNPPPSVQKTLANSFYAWLGFENNFERFRTQLQLKHWKQTSAIVARANWQVAHLGSKQLRLTNLRNGQVKNLLLPFAPDAHQTEQIKLSPNGQYLVFLTESAPYVYHLGKSQGRFLSKEVGFTASQVCFSSDSQQIAVLSEDQRQVSVYTLARQQLKTFPKLHLQKVKTLQFCQADQLLVASNHTLFRYDLRKQHLTKICDTGLSIEKIVVGPQRRYVLLINQGSPKVEIWTTNGQPILEYMPHYLRNQSALKMNNIAFSNQSLEVYFPFENGFTMVVWLPHKIYRMLQQSKLFRK